MNSHDLFARAQQRIPGGVNSPVRAFRSVQLTPPFIRNASGAHIWDVEGRDYVDYVNSWGPMILGHLHPTVVQAVQQALQTGMSYGAPTAAEIDMAELICDALPSVELVRMVNSGTEAVMSALRLARGYTGRDLIVKFAGCYHGHCDSVLVKAGSGLLTAGVPDSAGVPAELATKTLTATYNDQESVERLFKTYPEQIAAVIVEPVAGNMGVVPPADGFLPFLRRITEQHGALLIFDEVISGFRAAYGGAQAVYNVRPDLTTLGKIVGGGLPVGAYGGRRDIMEKISPLGSVYQAGTLSGNPMVMAAGLATLRLLRDDPAIYQRLEQRGARLEQAYSTAATRWHIPAVVNRCGSLLTVFFTDRPAVRNYDDAVSCDTAAFAAYFRAMLERGIYLAPSQFEAIFLCDALDDADLAKTEAAIDAAFAILSGQV